MAQASSAGGQVIVNTHDFISRYGSIYEHSPWVAEQAAGVAAGIDDPKRIAEIMADCVDNADVSCS